MQIYQARITSMTTDRPFFPQSPITEENEAWAQNSKCIHVDSARLEDTLEYT